MSVTCVQTEQTDRYTLTILWCDMIINYYQYVGLPGVASTTVKRYRSDIIGYICYICYVICYIYMYLHYCAVGTNFGWLQAPRPH